MLKRSAGPARRFGLTLAEVLVALALIAVLATVVTTHVLGRIRQGKAAAMATTLTSLRDGLLDYRADVRRYPRNLQHLSSAPPPTVTDLCGQFVPADFRAAWRGPYVKTSVGASGVVVNESTILDALELSPAGPYTVNTTGALVIVAQDVDSSVANELESRFDGDGNLAAGTIRFVLGAGGQGTLRFAIPVRGC